MQHSVFLVQYTVSPIQYCVSTVQHSVSPLPNISPVQYTGCLKTSTKFVQKLRELNKAKYMYYFKEMY